jgi:4-diphosphocytidyl-2-C-methyl-D-erythritol kinase
VSQVARVSAQAKLNLLLRVLAREASGYHSIESVFTRIELADKVAVRVASGRSLDCSGRAIPPDGLGPVEKNLAYRAAVAYTEATGWPNGFAIEVEKHIPVGGGLGGGSADAGAVLRALDALAPNPLGHRLIELATPLGADVPFMTIESPMALAWGRGERLLPLRPLDSRGVILVIPPFAVSTPDAYGWLSADRGTYMPTGMVLAPESLATWEAVAAIATNDFEGPVGARHELITSLVDHFRSNWDQVFMAMMSGSGSTVFGLLEPGHRIGGAEVAGELGCKTILSRTSERVRPVEVGD